MDLRRQTFRQDKPIKGIFCPYSLGKICLCKSFIYQKLWNVECYHKLLKQNVSLAKSPTHTEKTLTNHFFAALCGYIKLEMLKVETKTNHFALKAKLYVKALHSAFQTL
jgi:hypothetical protein